MSMTLRRLTVGGAGVAAVVLLTLSIWLFIDNQTVNVNASDYDDGHPAGLVVCTIAPYDAGFLGNDDPPGGEHSSAYSDEVAADCYSVNKQRFHSGVGTGVIGVVVLGVAVWSRARRRSLA
jgi:hypothetical protein